MTSAIFEPKQLGNVLGFGNEDPIFPATRVDTDEDNCFANCGLSRQHWATAGPVRKVFRRAFVTIGQPAYGPHSLRRMIVSEAYRRRLSIEEFKAWSQNLGHKGAMTTLTSYGTIGLEEQGRLVRTSKGDLEENVLSQIRALIERGSERKKSATPSA